MVIAIALLYIHVVHVHVALLSSITVIIKVLTLSRLLISLCKINVMGLNTFVSFLSITFACT